MAKDRRGERPDTFRRRFQLFLEILEKGSTTTTQLSEDPSLRKDTVESDVRALQKQSDLIHIFPSGIVVAFPFAPADTGILR